MLRDLAPFMMAVACVSGCASAPPEPASHEVQAASCSDREAAAQYSLVVTSDENDAPIRMALPPAEENARHVVFAAGKTGTTYMLNFKEDECEDTKLVHYDLTRIERDTSEGGAALVMALGGLPAAQDAPLPSTAELVQRGLRVEGTAARPSGAGVVLVDHSWNDGHHLTIELVPRGSA